MDNEKINKEPEGEVINVTKGFFKKVFKAVTNFEQYPELAAQGTWSAIKYLMKLILCFSFIILVGIMFQFRMELNGLISKFDQAVSELTYSNGTLDVKSDEAIVIEDGISGKIIIDTKTEDAQKITEYEGMESDNQNKIILLKDKAIIVSTNNKTVTYNYEQILNKMPNSSLNSFNKADLLNYLDTEGKYIIYTFYALAMFIGFFVVYFITVFFDSVTIALLGYITSIFANLKIRFAAIFNMSIYALTLSIILNMIYTVSKLFTSFEIKYFEVAYIAIAYIYITAAIFLLKANFIKKQAEVIKIIEEQDKVKIEIQERERQKEDKDKDKDKDKEDGKNKEEDSSKKGKKEDTNLKDSPEGSKA